MNDRPETTRRMSRANELLFGTAMLSVAAFHGFMLYLIARGSAGVDGFAPRIGKRA